MVMHTKPDLGVIFDMDSVLVDSAEEHFRSWKVLVEECGLIVSRAVLSSRT